MVLTFDSHIKLGLPGSLGQCFKFAWMEAVTLTTRPMGEHASQWATAASEVMAGGVILTTSHTEMVTSVQKMGWSGLINRALIPEYIKRCGKGALYVQAKKADFH